MDCVRGKEDKEEKDRQDGINKGCRKETGSWLQRQREGKRKEQSVRSNEDDAGGRTGNRDEERVQRTFSGGLHAAGDVDRVAKETVSRHGDSDHSSDHRATVQAAADHQLATGTMPDLVHNHATNSAKQNMPYDPTRNVQTRLWFTARKQQKLLLLYPLTACFPGQPG